MHNGGYMKKMLARWFKVKGTNKTKALLEQIGV